MVKLPLLPIDEKLVASQPHRQAGRPLPVFYMSDYSVLGLKVGNFEETIRILEDHKFSLINKSEGFEVIIDDAAQVHRVCQILRNRGIECGLTDIVDQVYQG